MCFLKVASLDLQRPCNLNDAYGFPTALLACFFYLRSRALNDPSPWPRNTTTFDETNLLYVRGQSELPIGEHESAMASTLYSNAPQCISTPADIRTTIGQR